MYSPEALSEIASIRAKVADGSATIEDMKRAVILLRGDRKRASTVSESSRRSRAKAVIPNANDLLNELGDI